MLDISWANSYNLMNRFIFINPFQNEKNFNGIPKIALRKSGTKTLKKFAGCGRIKFFSRYVIPEISSRGSIPATNVRGQALDSLLSPYSNVSIG
jgi:hypothetical protein